jgi:hypothetical protein
MLVAERDDEGPHLVEKPLQERTALRTQPCGDDHPRLRQRRCPDPERLGTERLVQQVLCLRLREEDRENGRRVEDHVPSGP